MKKILKKGKRGNRKERLVAYEEMKSLSDLPKLRPLNNVTQKELSYIMAIATEENDPLTPSGSSVKILAKKISYTGQITSSLKGTIWTLLTS